MFKELLDYLNPSRMQKEARKKAIEKFVEDNFGIIIVCVLLSAIVMPKFTIAVILSFLLYNHYK